MHFLGAGKESVVDETFLWNVSLDVVGASVNRNATGDEAIENFFSDVTWLVGHVFKTKTELILLEDLFFGDGCGDPRRMSNRLDRQKVSAI